MISRGRTLIRSDSESDIDQFVTVESYSTFPSVPPTFICELTDIGFAFSFCANQQTFALENNVESSCIIQNMCILGMLIHNTG